MKKGFRINKCCLDHSCNYNKNETSNNRVRNPRLGVLKKAAGAEASLELLEAGAMDDSSAKRRAPFAAIRTCIKSKTGLDVDIGVLQKAWQEGKGDKFFDYVKELMMLESVLFRKESTNWRQNHSRTM